MRYLSFGESHGKGLLATIDGFPAGMPVDVEKINAELRRRQGGYGRGARQAIEHDTVEILSGVIRGTTIGSPIALWVKNKDYKIDEMPDVQSPRPGHADLSGAMKYGVPIRAILERSSARETAARVAAGALVRQLLEANGVQILAYVTSIGQLSLEKADSAESSLEKLKSIRDSSSVYSLSPEKDKEAEKLIDECTENGDTLGGIIEIRADGLPFGLGTHTQWDERLDGKLAQALMSVQAIKGVEIGLGFESARRFGSEVHDAIEYKENRFSRPTNRAGGMEGGMTNTQPIVLRAAMKPIATLKKPIGSVDFETKQPMCASYERSDVCAVSACSVVLENAVAIELAAAFIKRLSINK